MNALAAASAAAIASFALLAADHPTAGALSTMTTLTATSHNVYGAHHKRGRITLYDDTFGDAVPAGITAGPDGALWFTNVGNNVIGRISVQGTMTQFSGLGIEISDGITTGPDGALWFTVAQSSAAIGRLTTSGGATIFRVPGWVVSAGHHHRTRRRAVVRGDQREGWTHDDQRIRDTLYGRPERRPVAGHRGRPGWRAVGHAIAVRQSRVEPRHSPYSEGKDESVYRRSRAQRHLRWSGRSALVCRRGCDRTANHLGQYTAFTIQGPSEFAAGIAAGPDGALWFTNFSGDTAQIGRLTTAGHMTLYRVPGSFPQAEGITPGPDGAMWFTSAASPAAIGRITTR